MAFVDELTTPHVHVHGLRSGMRLTPLQSRGAKLTEAETDDIIARTLAEDRQREARAAMPAIASQEELSGLAGRIARQASRVQDEADARLSAVTVQHGGRRQGPEPNHAHSPPIEDLTGRRRIQLPHLPVWPRRAIVTAVMLGVAWVWPGFVISVIFAAGLMMLGCILALGSDSASGALIRIYHWRHARQPERAERMRLRLDRLAMRVDTILDRLPERWTTGLYMADFSREALLPDEHGDAPDPFDKLRVDAGRA